MKISVVIPLYDKAGTIGRAVRSVFAQTRLPNALVVVDDGSLDGSAAACRLAMASAPSGVDCQLIAQKNAGVSEARNRGAEAVQSDFVAFLDADDEWLPDHLGEIELLVAAVPEVGILSTRHARLDATGRLAPEPTALPKGFFGKVENGLDVYRRGYGVLHTSTIAVSRAAWCRSGGFPAGARTSEDIHLWLRLLLAESFAHSGRCTGIRHEEGTGAVHRVGSVPAHFKYFFESEEGRGLLSNGDLMAFLSTNLVIHLAGHRLRHDNKVVIELLRLSRHLPLSARFMAWVTSHLPRSVLQRLAVLRQRARRARSQV